MPCFIANCTPAGITMAYVRLHGAFGKESFGLTSGLKLTARQPALPDDGKECTDPKFWMVGDRDGD